MSLNYDLKAVKNFKDLYIAEPGATDGSVRLNSATETIIFLTMIVGMNEITKKNHREFYTRVHAYEKAVGTFRRNHDMEPVFMTIQDIERNIGLSTNAANYTLAKFTKILGERAYREAVDSLRYAEPEVALPAAAATS